MNMRLMVAIASCIGGLIGSSLPALAQQTNPRPVTLRTWTEAFDRGITFSSQDTFSTTFTIGRQIDFMFGLVGFPEVEINRDASIVHGIYQDLMMQQYSNGPILRTPDLPNPYNSSLRTQPALTNPNQPLPGGEFWLNPIR
ncbi:MAG: hypothetical protein EA366_00530 [Spirulina sp. DLM2.Bin59]|nr:MAG: hypothetical protein EA366_00530 [Spirulina sp. DLM2.Bin59]